MAKVRPKNGLFGKTFVKEWREHRGLTQDRLAERIGVTGGAISQLETRQTGYTQGMLEALADALNCHVADLLTYSPQAVKDLRGIWSAIPEEDREQALRVLKSFVKDGTNG